MLRHLLPAIACVLLLALGACESYDFKVNDTVVYSPQPLFKDFDAPDTALRTCLEQAIIDGAVSTADQLSSLNCSHGGIQNLDGLSTFTAMKTLRLSSNQVRNLVEVGAISTLEELYLDNNLVIDPVPLYLLQALHFVDLSGNPKLQCPSREGFARVETVILPAHCR
jgi:Leucine-rich repeat (LRR) protein